MGTPTGRFGYRFHAPFAAPGERKGAPQQVAEYVKAEIVKWGKVVRDTGAKPD